MSIVHDATPGSIQLGAQDNSAATVYASQDPIPQHLPLSFIFGQKGTTKTLLLNSAKRQLAYGGKSFDSNEKYFNHQTRYLNSLTGRGNLCATKRLIPTDAGIRSNAIIYIDVLETDIVNYLRTSSGKFIADAASNGYKVDPANPTIPGVKIKFIKEYMQTPASGVVVESALGLLGPKEGTMVDAVTGNKSMMYPFIETRAMYQGEEYNNNGFAFQPLYNGNFDAKIISKAGCIPFAFYLVSRAAANATPSTFFTLYKEPFVNTVFKKKTLNPTTEARIDLEYVFDKSWFNETDTAKALRYKEYEGFYFYRDNYELIAKKVLANEAQYVTGATQTWFDGDASTFGWFDFTSMDPVEIKKEIYLLNLLGCKSTNNVPYFTVTIDSNTSTLTGTQSEVSMSLSTPIFLSGGSDGTVSDEMYEQLVIAEMDKYLDSDTEVHDTAINKDSIIWDSGYSLPVKKALINYITVRKDTHIAIATHIASFGEKCGTLSEERAIAVALKSKLSLAPESEYFATGVARGIICLGSGILRDGTTTDRVPLTYEIAMKSAEMMGASDGKWKESKLFDRHPGSELEYLIDYKPEFIPESIKPTIWSDGIVYAQPYDRDSYFIPAVQTVYSDDTSILNNFYVTMALCTLSKIADDAWRTFSGVQSLTNGQFVDAVDTYVAKRLNGLFAGLFTVKPETVITEEDEARGYSWHLVCKLYGNNMKTKMVYSSEVYRQSALDSTAS